MRFTGEIVSRIPKGKFKQSAEIELVINSYHCGDLFERKSVVFDHGGGFSYSEVVQITGDACSDF